MAVFEVDRREREASARLRVGILGAARATSTTSSSCNMGVSGLKGNEVGVRSKQRDGRSSYGQAAAEQAVLTESEPPLELELSNFLRRLLRVDLRRPTVLAISASGLGAVTASPPRPAPPAPGSPGDARKASKALWKADMKRKDLE